MYDNYKIEKKNYTINEICNPKQFELQPQQKFLPEYIFNNLNKINGLLIFHNIGSGKTCTAIQISEKMKHIKKIMCVLPASLIGNFVNELLSDCGQYKNMDDINKYYTIYSHNIFVKKINKREFDLNNTLLIIDEIQNMISEDGVFYDTLKTHINISDTTLKLIMLSGTPIFDNPLEIALTLNLLRPPKLLPVGEEFTKTFFRKKQTSTGSIVYEFINQELFIDLTRGLISYYRGAPPIAYPKLKLQTISCEMSDLQFEAYKLTVKKKKPKQIINNSFDLPNNFYIKSRMVSNIIYPEGYDEYTILNDIKMYSTKFYKLISNLSNNKIFIYSNFILAGLKPIQLLLELNGYKNFIIHGPGNKRFCIWSGEESKEIKEKIKLEFNKKENTYGELIQIFLGSPAAKEGITLKSVKEVHIMEPYWNLSRIKQIVGRAVRHCVHIDLPENERKVNVYIYISNHIDEYIWNLAKNKQSLIKSFENIIKENAIDCDIFINRNYYETDNHKLTCIN